MPTWITSYVTIMALLTPVFACAGVGAFWAVRKMNYPREFITVLVTSVSIPALVFHTLVTTTLNDALLVQIVVAASVGLVLMTGLAAVSLRVLGLPVSSLLAVATFPNAGNLGLPIAQLAFGETGLTIAVTIFALLALAQHTLGVWLQSWAGRARTAAGSRWPVGVIVACLAALLVRGMDLSIPAPVLASAGLVGSLAVPLMLLSLGYALATVSRSSLAAGAMVGLIRTGSGILAGYAISAIFDLPPLISGVVVLQLLMPVAVVSYLYAERYTDAGDIAAGAILVSTTLFLFLSPVLISWVGGVPAG